MIIQGTSNLSPGTATLSRRKRASAGKFCGRYGAQGHNEDVCTTRFNDNYRMGCRCFLHIREIPGSNLKLYREESVHPPGNSVADTVLRDTLKMTPVPQDLTTLTRWDVAVSFIFGRSQFQVSIRRLSSFCGFPQSVHSDLENS